MQERNKRFQKDGPGYLVAKFIIENTLYYKKYDSFLRHKRVRKIWYCWIRYRKISDAKDLGNEGEEHESAEQAY